LDHVSPEVLKRSRAAARWILQNLYVQSAQSVQTIEFMLLRRHKAGWLFELTRDSEAAQAQLDRIRTHDLADAAWSRGPSMAMKKGRAYEVFPDLHAIHAWWMHEQHARLASYDKHLWPAHADREALSSTRTTDRRG
jgi:hypothetical protein